MRLLLKAIIDRMLKQGYEKNTNNAIIHYLKNFSFQHCVCYLSNVFIEHWQCFQIYRKTMHQQKEILENTLLIL